jgi:hypothetical protein
MLYRRRNILVGQQTAALHKSHDYGLAAPLQARRLAVRALARSKYKEMVRFTSEDEMLDAMRGGYYAYPGKAPRGMTKAQKAAFVAPNWYRWAECKCSGVPGARGRADYFVNGSENCPTHAHVRGNFTDDSVDK